MDFICILRRCDEWVLFHECKIFRQRNFGMDFIPRQAHLSHLGLRGNLLPHDQ